MANVELVVFDVAGTIIEDRGEVRTALGHALRKRGIPFEQDELKEWMGASKREVIRHFVARDNRRKSPSADVVELTYKLFRSELENLYRSSINPIPGAATTFAWCRERGIQLATTTGFYAEIRDLILAVRGRSVFVILPQESDSNPCGRHEHALERVLLRDPRQNRSPEA